LCAFDRGKGRGEDGEGRRGDRDLDVISPYAIACILLSTFIGANVKMGTVLSNYLATVSLDEKQRG
jgi:hypothetical protein